MKNLLVVTVLVAALAFSVSQVYAVSEAACLFLMISPGARAAGMGEAFVGLADDATAVFEQERNVGMQHAQKRLLAEVEDALKRMDAGSYGICRHCGARIDLARLKAMPTAALCLSCQEQQEQHNSWHG